MMFGSKRFELTSVFRKFSKGICVVQMAGKGGKWGVGGGLCGKGWTSGGDVCGGAVQCMGKGKGGMRAAASQKEWGRRVMSPPWTMELEAYQSYTGNGGRHGISTAPGGGDQGKAQIS